MITTHGRSRLPTLGAAFLVVSACSGPSGSGPAGNAQGSYAQFAPDAALLAAARSEGTLTTIALAHDWCNYGEVIATFKARTGLQVAELDPLAGSVDEIEAIKESKDLGGPLAPDVIDVSLAFGPTAKGEGLIANYKVETWDTIPANVKDAEGAWYGAYYGVFAFEVNTEVITDVPEDWADLLEDQYDGRIALAGDPRTSSQAILAVYAAGLASGGSLDDASKGLEFFKQLNDKGNLLAGIANASSIAAGETPITIRGTYSALWSRDVAETSGGPRIEVVVPASGRLAAVYVEGIGAQAISAHAPHPNAARLWQEFLYSDEGQNLWLKGYCHPIRYDDLKASNKIPASQLARLPDVTDAVFPTIDQLEAARKLITTRWDDVVGVSIR